MKPDEAERLIQQLFDDCISEQDFERLEEALTLDPRLHSIYRDHALLETELDLETNSNARDQLANKVVPMEVLMRKRQRRQLIVSISTAAAVFVLVGIILFFTLVERPVTRIGLRSAPDSRVLVSNASADQAETELRPGTTVEVLQGTSELTFPSGVRAIISAPANLTLRSDEYVSLHEGTVWFNVPPEGVGFQVGTPSLVVTDLGTEFVIRNIPGATEEVHVLKGKVEARSLRGYKSTAVLTAGDSRAVGIRGDLVKSPDLGNSYSTSLPDRLPFLHFSFDELEGNRVPIRGNRPELADLKATAIQSDGRSARGRLVSGRFGKAMSFDGAGDHIVTNWPGVYGAQPLTFAGWIRVEGQSNYGGIVGWGVPKRAVHEQNQWKILVAPVAGVGRSFRCSWGRHSSVTTKVDFKKGDWHHLAMVYSGEGGGNAPKVRLFIDGLPVGDLEGTEVPKPPRRPADLSLAQPLSFGTPLLRKKDNPNQFLSNTIDEVFLIEGVLSDSQIEELYLTNEYTPAKR